MVELDAKVKQQLDDVVKATITDQKNKVQTQKKDDEDKRTVAFAPPQIIRKGESDGQFSFARLVKAMSTGRWGEAQFEKEEIEKAMEEDTDTLGGYLVPTQYSNEIINILYAKAVVRAAGATVYPMQRNTLEIPKADSGTTSYWGEELGTKSASDMSFSQIRLVAKKHYAMVKLSNELIADSSPAVETVVRNDMAKQLALGEDLAFLTGSGVGSEPQGFDNIAGIGSTSVALTSLDTDDILDAMYQVENNNSKVTGFIMHPETANTLRQLKDANGRPIFFSDPSAKISDNLFGLPVYKTTQLPLAGSGGFLLCGDFSEAVIGQRQRVELASSEHVGFTSDSTYIRAVMRVDFAVKHTGAFYKVTLT